MIFFINPFIGLKSVFLNYFYPGYCKSSPRISKIFFNVMVFLIKFETEGQEVWRFCKDAINQFNDQSINDMTDQSNNELQDQSICSLWRAV